MFIVSFTISIFCIFLNFNSKDSCCCPAHFLENTCGCNFFNCNCDTSPDGYCIYSDLGGKCIADNCEKACESTFLDERFCKNKTKVISYKIYFISYEIKNSLIKHCLFFLQLRTSTGEKNKPIEIFLSLDNNEDGFISKKEFFNSSDYVFSKQHVW